MARELVGSLDESYNVQLDAAVATVPTITEIGMAALLPLDNRSLAIVPGKKGKLALQVDDVLLQGIRPVNYPLQFFQ
jgi:hypothetical protein